MQWGSSLLPLVLDRMNDNTGNIIPSVSNKGKKKKEACSLCVLLEEKNLKNQWRNERAASSLIYGCSSLYV